MIKSFCLIINFALVPLLIFGQKDSTTISTKTYKLNYFIDIPVTVGGLFASKYGTDYLRGREPKHPENIGHLTPNDVWFFDRGAAKQDPANGSKFIHRSDHFMRYAMFAPVVMFLDADVRDIWFDYSVLYMEAQSINAAAYLGGAIPISRLRPFMYNPNESMERKLGRNTTNSFFSGHTSVVATSTFFMVKVYHDLHPEAKNKMLWYGLASVPPLITGYYRYKAGKHFPTDILFGFAVGAATGILVPEWHKSKYKRVKLYPTYSSSTGQLGVLVRINI